MGLPPGFVDIQEVIESRKGSPFNAEGFRTYTLMFRVIISDRSFGPNTIASCPGIPEPYGAYVTPDGGEYDLNAFCVNIDPQKQDPWDWQVWIVTCTFSTEVPTGGIPAFTGLGINPVGSQQDPSQWLPVFSWDSETVTVALETDLNGNPFWNSANQPFTPAPVFEMARPVLLMERNQLSLARQDITNYAYAINSDTFLGCSPGTVRLAPITASQAILGGVQYWKCKYRFVFNRMKFNQNDINQVIGAVGGGIAIAALGNQPALLPADPLESWQPNILDAGTMQLLTGGAGVPAKGLPVPILGPGGIPVTQPVPLNGFGAQAVPEDGVVPAVYIPFTVYRARPFTPLLNGYNNSFLQ